MNRIRLRTLSIGALSVGVLLALALGLTLAFGGGPDTRGPDTKGSSIGEPLDETTKARYRSQGWGFIADTGRVIDKGNGHSVVIWDPPDLPTIEESIAQYDQAVTANDTGLVPLCTQGFLTYLKLHKEEVWPNVEPYFPACQGIPSGISIGPNRYYRPDGGAMRSKSDPDHTGYYYRGTDVSEGINGAISISDPSLNSGEHVAARFMAWRNWNGNKYWLEGGWAEKRSSFYDDEQHIYT